MINLNYNMLIEFRNKSKEFFINKVKELKETKAFALYLDFINNSFIESLGSN